jgi:hypothetical protein
MSMIRFASAEGKYFLHCVQQSVSLSFDNLPLSEVFVIGTVQVYLLGSKMAFICFIVESSGSGALSHSIKSPSAANLLFHNQKNWGSFHMPPQVM